jgi:hypothetical protein
MAYVHSQSTLTNGSKAVAPTHDQSLPLLNGFATLLNQGQIPVLMQWTAPTTGIAMSPLGYALPFEWSYFQVRSSPTFGHSGR